MAGAPLSINQLQKQNLIAQKENGERQAIALEKIANLLEAIATYLGAVKPAEPEVPAIVAPEPSPAPEPEPAPEGEHHAEESSAV